MRRCAAVIISGQFPYVIGVDLMSAQQRKRGGPLCYGLTALEVMIERSGGGLASIDCLITPELAGFTYFDSGRFENLLSPGQRAAAARLDTPRAALREPNAAVLPPDMPQSSAR